MVSHGWGNANPVDEDWRRYLERDPDVAVLTVEQVAAHLGITVRAVRAVINSGELRASKIGKRLLVTVRALREFISARTVKR